MDTEKKNDIPVIAICGEDMGVRTTVQPCAAVQIGILAMLGL